MPSKYRTKKKAYRDHYIANVEAKKQNSQKYYQNHKSVIKCRTSVRKITDKTGKQKNVTRNCQKLKQDYDTHKANLTNTKRRLETDELYRDRNRARTKQRWQNEVYRDRNRARSLAKQKQRLQDDEQYRQENRARATVSTRKRLTENEHYRKLNITRATAGKKRKWQESESYRQQESVRATIHKKNTTDTE